MLDGWLPYRKAPTRRTTVLRLAKRAVQRQAMTGTVVYAVAIFHLTPILLLDILALVVLTVWSRLDGLVSPRTWPIAILEGFLLLVGALCFANILLVAFGYPR